jgi:spore coat-associated protein N
VDRISFLIKNPRRALGCLAAIVAATGVVIGSGANFTASSANPSNQLATGQMSIDNDKEGLAILSATDLRPGGPAAVGTVDILNDGTLGGTFTLSRGTVSDDDATYPLSAKLNLVITDCGAWTNPSTVNPCGDGDDTVIYGATPSTIAAMTTVGLGSWAPNAKHRYRFSVQLDASAGDDYEDDSSTVAFAWSATSS